MPPTLFGRLYSTLAVYCCAAGALLMAASLSHAQAPSVPANTTPNTNLSVIAVQPGAAKVAETSVVSKPEWQELNPAQQKALQPLAVHWPELSSRHKNKWLEVAKTYASLPAPEQAKLHARMAEWSTLSPQQRTLARQNFAAHQAVTRGLTPEQRNVQWQAYQLLSTEEKSKLAASSPQPAPRTAVAVRPAEPLRSSPPVQFGTAQALSKQAQNAQPNSPKISIAPHLKKTNSLMPQKTTVAAATTTANPAGAAPAEPAAPAILAPKP